MMRSVAEEPKQTLVMMISGKWAKSERKRKRKWEKWEEISIKKKGT